MMLEKSPEKRRKEQGDLEQRRPIAYLKEKSEKEFKIKQEELEIKKNRSSVPK